MMSKKCNSCGLVKTLVDFVRHRRMRDGYLSTCKVCWKTKQRKYRSDNLEAVRRVERDSKRKTYDSDQQSSLKKRLYWSNPEKYREVGRKYYARNKEYYFDRVLARNARRKEATPKWLSEPQKRDIFLIYSLRRKLSRLFGVEYEVDHIVPLQGLNVCGLHVPWNLQILEKSLNRSKSNKLLEEVSFDV